ncbi:MAG: phosphoglycerate kinase [Alphaproteobacteria bacterium]
MAEFRTIDDLEIAGKRVLLRGDLNVPMQDGRVSDTLRLDRLAGTILDLAGRGGRIVVLSHFGRPKGKPVAAMSLEPIAEALSRALGGRPVSFAGDCIGAEAAAVVDALEDGAVAVLENLRFHPGEEANAPEFAEALAALGDCYVNDAFSVCHRAHASTQALARLLPAAAGRALQAEIEALEGALENPRRPLAALVGGAKVSSKIGILENLAARVDALVIGGAMANTFVLAGGTPVGASLVEPDMIATANRVVEAAARAGCAILLPVDAVVAPALAPGVGTDTVPIDAVPPDQMILDIGPASVRALEAALAGWRTLVWNGPLGAFETPPFDAGTTAIARAAAGWTGLGTLTTVAGGGDTVAALAHAGVDKDFTYISTAGGAFLEWLEGKELPGLAVLLKTA